VLVEQLPLLQTPNTVLVLVRHDAPCAMQVELESQQPPPRQTRLLQHGSPGAPQLLHCCRHTNSVRLQSPETKLIGELPNPAQQFCPSAPQLLHAPGRCSPQIPLPAQVVPGAAQRPALQQPLFVQRFPPQHGSP
jgi:hypothetical protein